MNGPGAKIWDLQPGTQNPRSRALGTGPQNWVKESRLRTSGGCFSIGEKRECLSELENQHSEDFISVHLKETNQRTKIIRHIPDVLAKVNDGTMSEWKEFSNDRQS